MFGTFNATTAKNCRYISASRTLQDVITVAVTADNGVAGNIDSNPQIAPSLNSVNSWNAIV